MAHPAEAESCDHRPVPEGRAAQIFWALASPDVARMLRDVQGWTTGEYAAWLEETLAAALLTAE